MRWLAAVLVVGLSLWAAAGSGVARAADCGYQILPLAQMVQQSPVAVIADGYREQKDASGGFTSTLEVRGTIKGRPPGPYITIQGLGHPSGSCAGGPRLQPGSRYVLFIGQVNPTSPTSLWGLIDADGSVYTLNADSVVFPPDQPLGQPRPASIGPADFVRRVGTLSHVDNARIDDLIRQLDIQDPATIGAASAPQKPFYERLPLRETALVVAGVAIIIAGLIYLVWRPQYTGLSRRP